MRTCVIAKSSSGTATSALLQGPPPTAPIAPGPAPREPSHAITASTARALMAASGNPQPQPGPGALLKLLQSAQMRRRPLPLFTATPRGRHGVPDPSRPAAGRRGRGRRAGEGGGVAAGRRARGESGKAGARSQPPRGLEPGRATSFYLSLHSLTG